MKKLRLALILAGLSLLAVVSTVFGMMMALASDLPALETRAEFKQARNSVLLDVRGNPLGVLTGNDSRILVEEDEISLATKHAVIAVEDRRFYSNAGIDVRGIARAFIQDVVQQKAAQGGSTITQQFVKNALKAQSERTLFQKLREAAVAYHLTRKWDKQKILKEYLNSVYFGNGAYGVESAARTYFGWSHPGCGTPSRPCARELRAHEAALIAGIIASPSGYDPIAHPTAAERRRNLVLRKMRDEGYVSDLDYRRGLELAIPGRGQIRPPREESKAPYFTTWVRQQVVDRFGPRRAFSGGLRIRTTLDLQFQEAAQQAVKGTLGGVGPAAALVAIDNDTGEVRAMVGGDDEQFFERPFNLATQGQRQPGSAFKPFVLAAALRSGIQPGSVWESRKREFTVPKTNGKEKFIVNNYEDSYSGVTTLARATTTSDNAVYAAVGIKVGVSKVAKLAEEMGIRTEVSRNLALTLGGLKEGVTPLDMAHAYQTIAKGGRLVSGTLGAPGDGPVGIRRVTRCEARNVITCPKGEEKRVSKGENEVRTKQVLPQKVAETTSSLLQGVVRYGTGKRAALGGNVVVAGKTGTTENYGDAWFIGFTEKYTVAVWVGYPNELRPMETEFGGEPVAGGTYPATIWRSFMTRILALDRQRAIERGEDPDEAAGSTVPVAPTAPAPQAPEDATDTDEPAPAPPPAPNDAPAPPAPTPPQPAPTPAPAPQQPPVAPAPEAPADSGGAAPPQ